MDGDFVDRGRFFLSFGFLDCIWCFTLYLVLAHDVFIF